MNLPKEDQLAEKLKADVYSLCLPEGRMVGTEGHKTAERYLSKRLKEVGCKPYSGDSFEMSYVCLLYTSPSPRDRG